MPSTRKQLNIRLSDEARELLERLTVSLGLSQADVVQLGLRLLEQQERRREKIPKNPKHSA